VGLTGREQASPFHLSGGQQRLCALAGILAMEPDVLVLDEPMAGLDPHGRTQLRDIIARINAQGTTVVQITHSMNDAATSQQVIVLNEGKLLMQGAPEEVFTADTRDALHTSGLGLPDALTWALRLEANGLAGLGSPLTPGALVDALVAEASPAPEPEEVSARGL
jgi:energy-coupling factor transport system ATP-binding protein